MAGLRGNHGALTVAPAHPTERRGFKVIDRFPRPGTGWPSHELGLVIPIRRLSAGVNPSCRQPFRSKVARHRGVRSRGFHSFLAPHALGTKDLHEPGDLVTANRQTGTPSCLPELTDPAHAVVVLPEFRAALARSLRHTVASPKQVYRSPHSAWTEPPATRCRCARPRACGQQRYRPCSR